MITRLFSNRRFAIAVNLAPLAYLIPALILGEADFPKGLLIGANLTALAFLIFVTRKE